MKKNIVTLIISFVLCLGFYSQPLAQNLPSAKPEEVGLSSERLSRIDQFIQTQIKNKKMSGAVVFVGRKGKVAYMKAFGLADIENKKPMRTDTLFRLCSSSKMISAVAAMIAWEDGLFYLYDPVTKYIPEMKDLTVIEYDPNDTNKYKIVPANKPMFVYQSLNFTSGFTYHLLSPPAMKKILSDSKVNDGFWPNDYTMVEYLKERIKVPLVNHPGERWNYGTNLQIIGAIVEKTSGMSFGDFCRERIFKPLGMKDTYFFVPDDKMDRVAALYFNINGEFKKAEEGKTYVGPEYGISEPTDPFWFRASKNPKKYFALGEGIISTMEDYSKFLQMLVNGGELNGVRILSPKTIEFMTANHIKNLPYGTQSFGTSMAGYGWGLGFAVLDDAGVGHHIGTPVGKGKGGQYYWSGWMGTRQYIDPEEDLIMMIMSQKLPWPQNWINKVKDLVYQAIID
jgi:CubicO group peptidase (beta-lactamase class C family)